MDIKKELTKVIKNQRKTYLNCKDLNKAQFVNSDVILIDGKKAKRKRIVLFSKGCSVATCSMCPLPNEALNPKTNNLTEDNLINQIKNSFKNDNINNYDQLTIYNNGNFFSDAEIPQKVRDFIYNLVTTSNIKYLVVESLPQFITLEKLSQAKNILQNKKLIVAIGLQSSNDLIREKAINSTCTRSYFEKSLLLLKQYDFEALVFLMIKPPFLKETEAIEDVINSVKYLESLGVFDPMLCPLRISENTLVSLLYNKKLYTPPSLWTVLSIINKILLHNHKSLFKISTSLLKDQDRTDSLRTTNCKKCSSVIIKNIEDFNLQRNPEILNINCECYQNYLKNFNNEEKLSFFNQNIEDRIVFFLSLK